MVPGCTEEIPMTLRHPGPAALAAALLLACGDGSGPSDSPYNPDVPADLASAVTNEFFPLVPGTRWDYTGETDEGTETTIVEVLDETRVVNGVTARIVHDRVFLDGDPIEDTFDWYAQDGEGNVWYLGEDSKEIENGQVVSTEGSWEWGVDGALPGIVMWADPAAHVDEEYRQEYYAGVAEDFGKVVGTGRDVDVPYGSLTGCIETEDRNGLEPGSAERKFYCPGIGFALETSGGVSVELVDVTAP
jgi:hypothetical protein